MTNIFEGLTRDQARDLADELLANAAQDASVSGDQFDEVIVVTSMPFDGYHCQRFACIVIRG